MRLSVIIPAYNEEHRLPKTLQAVSHYLQKQMYEYEIIVVSDGSTDRTAERVRGLESEIPHLKLIASKQNRGKGYATRQGMLAGNGAWRVFMDADNATGIEHVERMWPEFEEGYEVVITSRDLPQSVIVLPQPWWRRKLGDLFNLFAQVFLGLWGIWDTQNGCKGFGARAAEDIFSRVKVDRWAFDAEVLLVAKQRNWRIQEIPAYWRNDAESKVTFPGMAHMLVEIAQIFWNSISGVYGKTSEAPGISRAKVH